MKNNGRFVNAGALTNYEMGDVREAGDFKRERTLRIKKGIPHWAGIWATVSNDFHPRSEAEWRKHLERDDDDEEEQRV